MLIIVENTRLKDILGYMRNIWDGKFDQTQEHWKGKGQPSESKAQATRNIMYGFESNLIKAFKYEFYKWDWDEKNHPLILIPKSN